jgi:hypothetical protein
MKQRKFRVDLRTAFVFALCLLIGFIDAQYVPVGPRNKEQISAN